MDCGVIKTLIKPVEKNLRGEVRGEEWNKILNSAINNEYRDELIVDRIITNTKTSKTTLVIANSTDHMNVLTRLLADCGVIAIGVNNLNMLSRIPTNIRVIIIVYNPDVYITSNSLPSNIDVILMTTYIRQPGRLANMIKRVINSAIKRRRPDIRIQYILDDNFTCMRFMYRLFIEIGSCEIRNITTIEPV